MAIERFLNNIFQTVRGGLMSDAETVVWAAWVQKLEQDEKEQWLYAQKLVDWYNRDTAAIREYVKEAATPLFKKSSKSWLVPVLNVVPRVIKRISLAYIQAPTRRLLQGDTEVEVGSDLWERVYGVEGMFRLIDIDKKFKEMDRWSTLLNERYT